MYFSENQKQQDGSQSRFLGNLYRQDDWKGPCDQGVQCVGKCYSHMCAIECFNEIILMSFSRTCLMSMVLERAILM